MTRTPHQDASRALRWVFFCMGTPVGTLVPRLAEIKAHIGATNAAYGSAMAIGGAGALLGTWLGGRLTHAFGGKRVAQLGIVLILTANVANALAPNVFWFAVCGLLAGFGYSTTNIGVNSQAVLVEQRLGRSFIPKAHAFWSLGTMLGAFVSSLAAPHISPLEALLSNALFSFVVYQWAARGLLAPHLEDRPHDDPSQLPRKERVPRGALRFLILIGVAQVLGLVAEMSAGDWSSVLLHEHFGVAVGPNGYGFTAFMILQLLGRVVAGRFIDRIGLANTIRAYGLIGTFGYLVFLALAAQATNSGTALVLSCLMYAFLGIAVGPMPSAFTTAAGGIPGLPSARGLMITSFMTASLGLLGRVSFAQIAQIVPLPTALAGMGVLIAITVSMASLLHPDRAKEHAIDRSAA